jgi:hypothetical protein
MTKRTYLLQEEVSLGRDISHGTTACPKSWTRGFRIVGERWNLEYDCLPGYSEWAKDLKRSGLKVSGITRKYPGYSKSESQGTDATDQSLKRQMDIAYSSKVYF